MFLVRQSKTDFQYRAIESKTAFEVTYISVMGLLQEFYRAYKTLSYGLTSSDHFSFSFFMSSQSTVSSYLQLNVVEYHFNKYTLQL